ncbi:MAG: peroxiredoxin [Propionibacteriaceae bacterium]|jgi:peroxiredoxin Q/BCP|nr:peroxiredoxin [Propionibacteriaceae bacterium]
MTELQRGDAAPDFSLPDASGQTVTLSQFAPGKVILYFYPAAGTPGCTRESVEFTAAAPDFIAAGYQPVGISPDSVEKLAAFTAKESLDVPLLADPDRSVIEAYGVWGERMIWGKPVTGVRRSTFVIEVDADGHGTIVRALYNVKATGHVARVRRELLGDEG